MKSRPSPATCVNGAADLSCRFRNWKFSEVSVSACAEPRFKQRLHRVPSVKVLGVGAEGYIGSRMAPILAAHSHGITGFGTGFYRDSYLGGHAERQFCSSGFDLPIGRVTRSASGKYRKYYTSADNLELIRPDKFAASLRLPTHMIEVLDQNRCLVNLNPKGAPRLGKRGIDGNNGGLARDQFKHALLWILNQSDGNRDLLSIAGRSGIQFSLLLRAARALERAGLVESFASVDREGERGGDR